MSLIGSISALALALTFAVAGISKLLGRADVVVSFRAMGLPAAKLLGLAVPVAEIAIAAFSVTFPVIGAVLALMILAPFSFVVARALRRGTQVDCGCFGAIWRKPLSRADLGRNTLLAALAVTVLASA